MGWTSIYQLFWGSLGTRVLTHPQVYSASSWCSDVLETPWGSRIRKTMRKALKLKEELEHGTLTAMNRELGIFDFNHEHRSCFFWVLILKPHQDICVIFAYMHPPEHTWWPLLRSKLGIAPLVNGSDNEKVAAPKSLYFLGILKSLNCQGDTLPKRPKMAYVQIA